MNEQAELRSEITRRLGLWRDAKAAVLANGELPERERGLGAATLIKALTEADRGLQGLDSAPLTLPPELRRWIDARKQHACADCWLSSNFAGLHPECKAIITEYFESDHDLYAYAQGVVVEGE